MGCIMCPSLGRRCVIMVLLAAGRSWKVLGTSEPAAQMGERCPGVRVWTQNPQTPLMLLHRAHI